MGRSGSAARPAPSLPSENLHEHMHAFYSRAGDLVADYLCPSAASQSRATCRGPAPGSAGAAGPGGRGPGCSQARRQGPAWLLPACRRLPSACLLRAKALLPPPLTGTRCVNLQRKGNLRAEHLSLQVDTCAAPPGVLRAAPFPGRRGRSAGRSQAAPWPQGRASEVSCSPPPPVWRGKPRPREAEVAGAGLGPSPRLPVSGALWVGTGGGGSLASQTAAARTGLLPGGSAGLAEWPPRVGWWAGQQRVEGGLDWAPCSESSHGTGGDSCVWRGAQPVWEEKATPRHRGGRRRDREPRIWLRLSGGGLSGQGGVVT